jgi:hypothetical protein
VKSFVEVMFTPRELMSRTNCWPELSNPGTEDDATEEKNKMVNTGAESGRCYRQ